MILNRHFCEKAIIYPFGFSTEPSKLWVALGANCVVFKPILITLLFACSFNSNAQNLSGKWTGILLQNNKSDTFYYQINIEQTSNTLSGVSFSKNKDGAVAAKFQIVGSIEDNHLFLQEIEQLEPLDAKWCLKNISLKLSKDQKLVGNWEADGCSPGTMELSYNKLTMRDLGFSSKIPEGKWVGHLSQSDRDYGFYFELTFSENGQGTSYIVSEGNGGAANHSLSWILDEDFNTLEFEESAVIKKTAPEWPWCIKSGNLKLTETNNSHILGGKWSGYIEGFTPETGSCASGTLMIEQPKIKTKKELQVPEFQDYVKNEGRKVEVGRILEVQNSKLKIKVWDNGIVDGDILSLFLNGKQLLKDFRVTKRKYTVNIQLEKKNNFLILHAEDLGKIMPNTVAVSVDDGVEEQIIILSSNLRESGAVMIRHFSVGE